MYSSLGSFFIPLFLILFLYFKIFLTQRQMMAKKKKKVKIETDPNYDWLTIPQLPDEGSKCRVDEVGSLDNGEAADNAHLTRLLPSFHNFCWFYITNFSGRPKSQEKSSASTFWHLLRWALQYFYSISKFDNQTQNIQFSFSSVFRFLVKKKACVYPWVFAHLRCWCCVFFWIKWPLGKAGNSIKPAMYT